MPSLSFRWSGMSCLRLRASWGSREELHAAREELRNKTVLLDGARREASEAISSVERLIEECHGL